MEGVGARFGRSSTRYGPTSTVFTGPVRKWHKKWIPNPNTNNKHTQTNANGSSTSSHLLFYKWAPVKNGEEGEGDDGVVEEPPKRKFRYVPVAVLEEQQNEAAEEEVEEKVKDEAKSTVSHLDTVDPAPKTEGLDEKPDINNIPMEEKDEDADEIPSTRQTVNLGFNLNSNEGDPESDDTNADEKC